MGNLIPDRSSNSLSVSQFIQNNINLRGQDRDNNTITELLNGNIPNYLRKFVPVNISDGQNSLDILVMPDYLSIGTDQEYLRIPMSAKTAQLIADKYDCSLPTRKLVNDIWRASKNKLQPQPIPPDFNIDSTQRFVDHNNIIQNQLRGKDFTQLTSGHKKDIVLTNELYPNNPNKRVSIYGWIQLNGVPIQDLNSTSHASYYIDYSQNVRLLANQVILNNQLTTIQNIFNSSQYAHLVSDEGVLNFQKY